MKRILLHLCSQDAHRQADRWRSSVDVLFKEVKDLTATLLLKLSAVANSYAALQNERIWPRFRLRLLCRMDFAIQD